MILLHYIVEVFALTQTNPTREDALDFQRFHSLWEGPVLVHVDDPWHRIAGRAQRLTEEALGGSSIPLGGEQKLDRLTSRIHRMVQIFVLAFALYIGFVRAVALIGGLQMGGDSVCSARVHKPAPSARCNWDPRPPRVPSIIQRNVRKPGDIVGTIGRKGESPRPGNDGL
jgi:hypothetical protein